MDEDLVFHANAVDVRSGDCFEPLTAEQMANLARAATPSGAAGDEPLARAGADGNEAHYGVEFDIDPCDLAQTGWGVIFPAAEPGTEAAKRQAALLDALQPLLQHRRAQASLASERYYQEYTGVRGYRPGETCTRHLARLGVDPSVPATPEVMPYYLLLVGSPEEIPFIYQYLLDVTYAVGRIHFDTIDEYRSYAKSVVEAETGVRKRPRKATFFGTQNGDDATKLSREQLVAPLASRLESEQKDTWSIERLYDADASKAALGRLLGGDETPALLFTASHGASFPCDDPLQLRRQGALICSEWSRTPGEQVKEDVYFSADDVSASADLRGLIAFNFACFGAGTPERSDYGRRTGVIEAHPRLASKPFIAPLHQRLLGHPGGGALAAVGHIDLAFSYSLPDAQLPNRIVTFRGLCKALMRGLPVGAAMEPFNQRFAALGATMSTAFDNLTYLEPDSPGALLEKKTIAKRWAEHNDARGYVVTGDPAVRLTLV